MKIGPDYLLDEERFQRAKAAARKAIQGMLFSLSDFFYHLKEIEGGDIVDTRRVKADQGSAVLTEEQQRVLSNAFRYVSDKDVDLFMQNTMIVRASGLADKEVAEMHLHSQLRKIIFGSLESAGISMETIGVGSRILIEEQKRILAAAVTSYETELDNLVEQYRKESKRGL